MSTIIINTHNKYKTKNGHDVIIFHIDESQPTYQVMGMMIDQHGIKTPQCWTINGNFLLDVDTSPKDLIEVPNFEIVRTLHKKYNFISVEYFGQTLEVPSYINYLGTDKNGKGYGFRYEPTHNSSYWNDSVGSGQLMAEFLVEGDWTQSLMEIKRDS